MAGKDLVKKQKRKKRSDEEAQEKPLSKVSRLTENQETKTHLEKVSPWMNLQLILSIQDKTKKRSEKIDYAFEYVKSSSTKETTDDIGRVSQVLSISRTLVVMNNWVQSVLVSSEKKMRTEEKGPRLESPGPCLDIRCWKILRFSLEESKKLQLPLTCLWDFLRVIRCVVVDASSFGGEMEDQRLELYGVVLDCVSLVFSFHGGVAKANLDLWILLMDEVVKLVLKVYTDQLGDSQLGKFVLQLTGFLLEPFAKFLKDHSTRKNGFCDFIDKLLEPLMHLLYLLRSSSSHGNDELSVNLSELVGEVLSQGLFHSNHIDGFLGSNNAVKYKSSSDATVKVEKLVNRSYHKHLFDKVEKIVSEKNGLALAGLGEMLHLFVSCVSNHKNPISINMNAEQHKFVLDFFVQIMEYVLSDVNKCLQPDMKLQYMLSNAAISLKSMSNLLGSLIYDKVYLRTEDTSEGGFQNFLRLLYDTVMSFSNSITHLQSSVVGSDERAHRDLLISVRKELIITVHNLLDIEYEVVGDDLENIWAMVFSSLACSCSSVDETLLFPDILSLGCKLIDLYSKFRQVDSSLFALCKAVKHSTDTLGDSESTTQSDFYSSYSNSVSKLLCSSEFRHPLSKAIKSIPEGQSAGFIRQLTSNIRESLEWINFEHHISNGVEIAESSPRNSDCIRFNLRAEVLGKVLTDVYAIILDSVPVSSGNSSLFGASLRNLIDSIYPSASKLISALPDSTKKSSGNVSTCWITVFLFRLLISCRSLLQQVVSLMPPDALKKNPGLIDNSSTAHSWKDWSEMSGCVHEGFSVPLLSIINSVSHMYTQDSVVICPPLCYVLHSMAIQRLADLNRLINTSEYMLQWNRNLSQTNLEENSDFSSYRKRAKKWKKCVSKMKEEAESLTKFILGYISTVDKDQIIHSSFGGSNDVKNFSSLRNYDTPEFSVGSLDHKLLPLTMWLIVCESVDLWCSHASKKDLKYFLTLIIEAVLSCESGNYVHNDTCNVGKAGVLKKVVAHQIVLWFLSNTIFHEQRSIRRYMASRFCKILKNSVSSVFNASGTDLSTSPDWMEVMSAVENLSDVEVGSLSCSKPNMGPAKLRKDQTKVGFATCQHLLAFLIRMPGVYLSLKSSSLYITCILNFERLLVDSMLSDYNASHSLSPHESLQLFVSCRRVLKFLTAASCMKTVKSCPSPESPVPPMWLLKSLSAASRFQQSLPQDNAFETKNALFSLIDHTSNVFQTISRDQFERGIGSSKKFQRKRKNLDCITEESDLSEHGFQIEESFDGNKSILQLMETLVEHMQNSQTLAGSHDLTKSTSVIACLRGLLAALVSSFGDKDAVDGSTSMKLSSYHVKLMIRINPCVMTCNKFLTSLLKAFFLEDGGYDVSGDTSDEGEVQLIEKNVPSTRKGGVRKCYFKRNSNPAIPEVEAFLANVQNVRQCLKKSLLVEVVRGENHEVSLFLQQLFLACSAILRLDLQTDMKSISWSLFPIVVGIAEFILLEFSSSTEMPHTFGFYCLNAIVKFIEVLGSYFSQTDPILSRVFINLVDLHIMAIGKCISFQRKEAKLASQETGSFSSIGTSQLGEFKRGLRMSFETYVKESSELRLLSVIEAVERALVGVKEGQPANYEILIRGLCGGEVSSVVAAGVDCLDLVLEFVTGHKHSNTLKSRIKSSIACLYNIILHLQASSIFFQSLDSVKGYSNPDPGSAILMCIGTLSTIYGKPSFFHIESCHIAQSLRVPGALFQYFLQLQLSQSPNSNVTVDWNFSIELYTGCCRLLCSSLKHHNNESLQCVALFQDSINVLLHCLEIVRIEPVDGRNSRSTWEVQEAVKCASSLRRVYEEVRQQKDTFGKSSYLFLSSYIWVYCGFGPAKRGIIREVDEALKPGIYALIDSCSKSDFQLLHTTFGEGPCRSTLAALEHDYKVNYQYQGKV